MNGPDSSEGVVHANGTKPAALVANVKKPKKAAKHSKKFVRTQTGCLQCRQKKKKCDGKRPTCVSCSKRGICCEFPANIRVFQFDQSNRNKKASISNSKLRNPSIPVIKHIDSIELKAHEPSSSENNHVKDTNKESDLEDTEITNNIHGISGTINKNQTRTIEISSQSDGPNEPSFFDSRSSLKNSSVSSLNSDTSLQSKLQEFRRLRRQGKDLQLLLPRPKHQLVPSLDCGRAAEQALSLVNDGKSIHGILSNIAVDLIKQSISNLKYIHLESKVSDSRSSQGEIMPDFDIPQNKTEGLKLVDCFNSQFNCGFNAEDYVSLDKQGDDIVGLYDF